MAKEIIIHGKGKDTQIAIVEDGKLTELHVEDAEHERSLGDIYLGRVCRIVPNIESAFVDIGHKQNAFLHFKDLHANLVSFLAYAQEKSPRLSADPPNHGKQDPSTKRRKRSTRDQGEHLKKGQRILVQVAREPMANKGPRVTAKVSLAGRFLVLIPVENFAAISRSITTSKERRRLQKLARRMRPEGFGLIVRTVATGTSTADLEKDLKLLLQRWRQTEQAIARATEIPAKVYAGPGIVSSVVRDLFSQDYDRILIDQRHMYRGIRRYIHAVAPHMAKTVMLHKSRHPIFEATALKKAVDEAYSPTVKLPSGGCLVIEQTEAMHVIDVNSGSGKRGLKQSREQYAYRTNMEAARAITHQMRLRDMGGLTVVDFIGMRDAKHRASVYDTLVQGFTSDRAETTVLPMSELGLVQIARQRTRQEIHVRSSASEGNGRATPQDLVASMEAWLHAHRGEYNGRLTLVLHPFTAAYLRRGIRNHLVRWQLRHKVRILLKDTLKMPVMDYRFEAVKSSPSAHGTGSTPRARPAR